MRFSLLLMVAMLVGSCYSAVTRLSADHSQCSLLVDSLTGGDFDFYYKDGVVVSLEPNSHLDMQCVPEYEGDYPPGSKCQWAIDGNDIFVDSYRYGYYRKGSDGCIINVHINPYSLATSSGNSHNNVTCTYVNSRTKTKSTMSYLIYFLSKVGVLGSQPIMSDKILEKQPHKGEPTTVTCEASTTTTSSVIQLNWYRLNKDGTREDVTTLEKHAVSLCGIGRYQKVVHLTLTISDITKDMWNRVYECVATKLDVWSYYNQTFSHEKYNIHSAPINGSEAIRVVLKPNITSMANLTFYKNNTKSTCNPSSPCSDQLIFNLTAPEEHVLEVWQYIAIAVVLTVAILTAVIIVFSYMNRVPIRCSLKHRWAITKDVVNPDFEHQAVIFYAENCDSEEEFVQGKLLIKLENAWKYTTFVPQRDNLIGANTAEQIINALGASQKIIFLMTEALFANEWNVYALDVALKEHRRIIIIKREDMDFQALLELHGKNFSEVDSALKVSAVIDWHKEKHKWKRMHLEMPVIVTSSIRHRITYRLRQFLRSIKRI